MTSKWVRASNNSTPADWVGKCTRCGTWRTQAHTIINRTTSDRFCMFDGGAIQIKCVECCGSGKLNGMKCEGCNGLGMNAKPQIIKR